MPPAPWPQAPLVPPSTGTKSVDRGDTCCIRRRWRCGCASRGRPSRMCVCTCRWRHRGRVPWANTKDASPAAIAVATELPWTYSPDIRKLPGQREHDILKDDTGNIFPDSSPDTFLDGCRLQLRESARRRGRSLSCYILRRRRCKISQCLSCLRPRWEL